MSVKKIDELVATTTIINSTAETSLGTMTIPASVFVGQGGAAMSMSGTVLNTSAAAGTARLRAKVILGGTTSVFAETTALSCSTSNNSRAWTLASGLIGSTLSTQLRTWSDVVLSAPSTSKVAPSTYSGVGYGSILLPNTSAQSTIEVTAQLSAASTNFSFTSDAAELLQVN
jgi:hypothetical protein